MSVPGFMAYTAGRQCESYECVGALGLSQHIHQNFCSGGSSFSQVPDAVANLY